MGTTVSAKARTSPYTSIKEFKVIDLDNVNKSEQSLNGDTNVWCAIMRINNDKIAFDIILPHYEALCILHLQLKFLYVTSLTFVIGIRKRTPPGSGCDVVGRNVASNSLA